MMLPSAIEMIVNFQMFCSANVSSRSSPVNLSNAKAKPSTSHTSIFESAESSASFRIGRYKFMQLSAHATMTNTPTMIDGSSRGSRIAAQIAQLTTSTKQIKVAITIGAALLAFSRRPFTPLTAPPRPPRRSRHSHNDQATIIQTPHPASFPQFSRYITVEVKVSVPATWPNVTDKGAMIKMYEYCTMRLRFNRQHFNLFVVKIPSPSGMIQLSSRSKRTRVIIVKPNVSPINAVFTTITIAYEATASFSWG